MYTDRFERSWRFTNPIPSVVFSKLQAEVHRDRIYGAHIAEYMEYLTEEDEAKYKEHFAEYIKNEITFDDIEDMYKVRHALIVTVVVGYSS